MSSEEEPLPRVDVWEQAPGSWRWRYIVGEESEHLELASNTSHPSCDAAIAGARLAYPGVPVRLPASDEEERTAQESHQLLWAGLTATVSLALAAVALRSRRWWLALAAPVLAAGVVSRIRRRLP